MNLYLPQKEAHIVGSLCATPTTPWKTYLHLSWKVSGRPPCPASLAGRQAGHLAAFCT